ncbi:MAG: hypothetical protein PWP40_299 [Rhodocyclaceae bacterium]|nr:hypothetical protein [Rhodocyclaceae bacterium]
MSFSERAFPHGLRAALFALVLLVLSCAAQAQTMAIVSARQSGLTEIDRESAEQLYLGRRTTLPNGRAVTLVDLPAGSVRDRFYLQLTRKNPSQIRAYWSRLVFTGRAQPPREATDEEDARRIVLTTPGAIAYLPIEAARHPDLLVLFKLD